MKARLEQLLDQAAQNIPWGQVPFLRAERGGAPRWSKPKGSSSDAGHRDGLRSDDSQRTMAVVSRDPSTPVGGDTLGEQSRHLHCGASHA